MGKSQEAEAVSSTLPAGSSEALAGRRVVVLIIIILLLLVVMSYKPVPASHLLKDPALARITVK